MIMYGKKLCLMKKILFLIAVAILAMVACSREELFEYGDAKFVLTASHEGFNGSSTRTTLGAGDAVNWAAGDQIKLVWNGGSVTSNALESAGSSATFGFASEPGSGNVYAVYPASATASYDGTEFLVEVPQTQDGSFASASIEVAAVSGNDVTIKHLASLLEISITDASVRSFKIAAYNNKEIAGTAEVTFSAGVPVIGTVTGGSSSVTVNVSGVGTYYVALLPVNADKGFYIELFDAENAGGNSIGKKIGNNALVLARKNLVALGSIGASEVLARWRFHTDADTDLFTNWCGGTMNNSNAVSMADKVGDTGQYILSTDKNSRMKFIQADRDALGLTWASLYLYTTAQPGFKHIWVGDAFEFDVANASALSKGATIRMTFCLRVPSATIGCYMLEYYAGGAWHAVENEEHAISTITLSGNDYSYNIRRTGDNVQTLLTYCFALDSAIPAGSLKIRIRAAAPYSCGGVELNAPSDKQGRFRGVQSGNDLNPVIEVTR